MIRYRKLGYVALTVTDIEKSIQYYRDLVGLDLVERVENGPAFLSCSQDHHNVVLYEGKEAGLKRVAFEVESEEELEKAFEHFTKQGLNPVEVDESETKMLRQRKTIRFQDPYAGTTFELYNDMMYLARIYTPTVANIARLGHVVINVVKYEEMVDFMLKVMNFRASDFVGDVTFMRCFPNPYHHSFGVSRARGDKDELHHVNFMVTDVDDVGKAKNRMIKNDVEIVFGPGRHRPSDSIFIYFLDPDGMTTEYSFGMEEFPEEKPRKPRYLEPSLEILDIWGGAPDPRMGSGGKIIKP